MLNNGRNYIIIVHYVILGPSLCRLNDNLVSVLHYCYESEKYVFFCNVFQCMRSNVSIFILNCLQNSSLNHWILIFWSVLALILIFMGTTLAVIHIGKWGGIIVIMVGSDAWYFRILSILRSTRVLVLCSVVSWC